MERKAKFISSIRKSIILTLGTNDAGRISLASKSYRWPFAPCIYCSQGLILAPGVIVGYHVEPCGCFESMFLYNKPNSYAVFNENGTYEIIYGSTYYDSRQPNLPVTKNGTNAYLYAVDKKDTNHRAPIIRRSALQVGESVFSIGINQGIWLVTSGKFLQMDGLNIITDCNVYHGLCGAPLFDSNGYLVGWGANLPHYPLRGITWRKYDVGTFRHISEIIDHLTGIQPYLERAGITYS